MTDETRPDPLVGRTVAEGRYEVLALLGRGGMGVVYRARQHPLERLVALKLIHRELAAEREIVERFRREMRVTAAIEHPHTVRLYDFGEIDGQPFLAMEYLEGRTLREVLAADGPLPPARLIAVALQVSKALRAAHAAGVIHRDLKPDNVMLLDRYGEPDFVKVLDFGIARPLEDRSDYRTAAGALVGTPEYMSPEQASGATIDARSDLYMLGVMLYELAAGTPPFVGTSITALLLAHATEAPPPFGARGREMPPGLEALILQLLEKSPDARPSGADAVIEALTRIAPASAAGGPTTTQEHPATGSTTTQTSTAGRPTADAPKTGSATGHVGGTLVLETGADPPIGSTPKQTPPIGDRDARPAQGSPALRILVAAAALGLAIGVVGIWLRNRASHADAPDDERGQAALRPLLEPDGEPPWPEACRTRDPGITTQLYAAAGDLGAPSGSADQQRGLAALQALPDATPERSLIRARLLGATDPGAALPIAERAAALCPSSAVAQNLVGNALQKLQRLDQAQEAYRNALRLAPDYAAPRFNLGLVQLRAGDATGALATFDEIAKKRPDYPNLFLVRAEAHRRANDRAAVVTDLEEHVKHHPDSAEGWFHLGRAVAEDDHARANRAFCRAAELGHADARKLCEP